MAKGAINVNVDLSDAFNGVILRRAQVEGIAQSAINEITQAVYFQISKEAAQGLKKTRNLYVRNINAPVMGRMKGSITLTGMLPNMLEQGVSAFDIKAGFAKSAKKKMKKGGGWYMTIPFRHAASGSLGESAAFSNVMDKPVHEMAKQLKGRITLPFIGTVRQGGQISAAQLQGSKFGILGRRALIESDGGDLTSEQKAAYTHKAPIQQGIHRARKFYGLVGQNQYGSFRRVSDRSAPNSWIHKGLKARNFMIKAINNTQVDAVAARSIGASLDALGFTG